jgi:hypothetical protein
LEPIDPSRAGARLTDVGAAAAPSAESVQDSEDSPSWVQRLFCKECFQSSTTATTTDDDTGGQPNAEGVAALLAIATDAVADERERGRALDTKCASLAGFTGLILSLTGAFAPALLDSKLGKIGQPTAEVAFFVAIVSLLLAVLVAVMGVLMPQKYRSMGTEQVANFARPSVQREDALWVHQSMLGALADILAKDRPVNNCKARLTRLVARFLAVGFLAVAVEASTIAIRQFGT